MRQGEGYPTYGGVKHERQTPYTLPSDWREGILYLGGLDRTQERVRYSGDVRPLESPITWEPWSFGSSAHN